MDKKAAYVFLQELVQKYPGDAVLMLQDIIVDYLLFPHGDGVEAPEASLGDMDKEVAQMMNTGQKINAVKLVRDRMGVSLKEAKDYVEQRSWPMTGKSEAAMMAQVRYVKSVVEKIRKDYNMVEES